MCATRALITSGEGKPAQSESLTRPCRRGGGKRRREIALDYVPDDKSPVCGGGRVGNEVIRLQLLMLYYPLKLVSTSFLPVLIQLLSGTVFVFSSVRGCVPR